MHVIHLLSSTTVAAAGPHRFFLCATRQTRARCALHGVPSSVAQVSRAPLDSSRQLLAGLEARWVFRESSPFQISLPSSSPRRERKFQFYIHTLRGADATGFLLGGLSSRHNPHGA